MKHWSMSMREAVQWWATIDKGGTYVPGIRALCLIDRFYLLVSVCGRTDMLHPWVYARCREVERDPDNHLDLWAREHFKSSIITFGGVVQEILKDPEITICIFSHTYGIATKFLQQVKIEFERNDVLKAAFADVLWSDPTKQANQWSVERGITVRRTGNPKESTLEASGLVDGQPTSKHFKLRVYDDVVTKESVSTPEQIKKTTDAYSLSQSLGVENGREWMIGTRYSYADTYDWVLTRKALTPRVYPATTTGQPDGPLVLFSEEHWKNLKRKSTDGDIACQYMQNPLSGNQGMFDIGYIQMYEVRPEALRVYIVIDPARSKKRDSADTAMLVVGVDAALNKFLLDGFVHKMDLKERWENMTRLWMRWVQQPGIQSVDVGYEAFGAQADLDYFQEQMRKKDTPKYVIKELMWPRDTEGSKVDRVQRLVPDVKDGKIYVPYYPKDEERRGMLTTLQAKMKAGGREYLIAQEIKKINENGEKYDITDKLMMQVHYFPYGGKKDAVDALSRIYDMEVKPPTMYSEVYMEPEFV